MEKYQKTTLLEVIEDRGFTMFVQNEGDSSDQWEIPKPTFESTYVKQKNDFGWAIQKLKDGHKVARKGWNGKGMWIALMPSLYLDKSVINGRTKKHIGNNTDLDSQPYLVMWTASNQWQPGWLASQSDILSEDWELVE